MVNRGWSKDHPLSSRYLFFVNTDINLNKIYITYLI